MRDIPGRIPDSAHLRHFGVRCLTTRSILGAAGVLLLVSLDVPASGRDDKPKPAPAPAKGAEDDNEIKQLAAQYTAIFRQLYRAELSFMRLATNLNKRAYEKIAAEGEPAMKASLQKWARNCHQGAGNYFNPIRPMTDAITMSVHKHLSVEQAGQYEKELAMRNTARKRMAVANLVAEVDKALLLSANQRQQLGDVLTNNWDESWSQTQYYISSRRWFPRMPDEKILPILTQPQQIVWKGVAKRKFGHWFFGNGEELEEEVWPEDLPQKNEASAEILPPPRDVRP
jgi:hypothetical protein